MFQFALRRLRIGPLCSPLRFSRTLQTTDQAAHVPTPGSIPPPLLKNSRPESAEANAEQVAKSAAVFDPNTRSRFRHVSKRIQRTREVTGKPLPPPILRGLPRHKRLKRRQRMRLGIAPRWNRPVAQGVLPAYDEALKVIHADSHALKMEFGQLQQQVKQAESKLEELRGAQPMDHDKVNELDEELEQMRQKLDIIEIQSEINLPSVRWTVRNTNVDMSKLVHRHLLEQSWREGGNLDLLMERLYQMHVVPDLVPAIHPSLDLRITTGFRPKGIHPKAKNPMIVEPGSFLLSKQTSRPPTLYTTVYHTDTRLYTLVLIDPDVPDEENRTFTTFLHWMKPNIPLSCKSLTRLKGLNDHTAYIPPHPQNGSPYHRYALFLLLQPPLTSYSPNAIAKSTPDVPTSKRLDVPVIPDEERLGFDMREFIRKWNIDPANGGGAHMWRQVWDNGVSGIYQNVLKKPEPRYGLPPKEDPYAAVKRRQKYLKS